MSGSPITWKTPLLTLHGVGPERDAQLARLGLRTVGDLLLHQPHRYEDRRALHSVRNLQLGQPATLHGHVIAMHQKPRRGRGRSLFELILEETTGRFQARWWNMPYLQRHFSVGDRVLVHGKPSSLSPPTLDHPECEVVDDPHEDLVHLNRVVPIYPLTEGLPQRWLRSLVWRILKAVDPVGGPSPRAVDWPGWPNQATALAHLHFPDQVEQAEAARQRLALDELFEFQKELQRRRRNLESQARGLPCPSTGRWSSLFLKHLPFRLTAAQQKVLGELLHNLASATPMRRLLQGDVGSGKTVVAAFASLAVLENNLAVALMAPTEILAEQHALVFRRWFEPLGIPVILRTAQQKADLPANQPCLVTGTHALLDETFSLPNLGLVVIDEQHKFGVTQRERLLRKGIYPHLLVMTATPIPRTLGLTLYGDLDVSVIDALPAGRLPVKTYHRTTASLPKVTSFLRDKLAAGHQAYIVYPRVEPDESQPARLKAVKKEAAHWTQALAPHRVSLIHGRLPWEEKESVMAAFRAGQIKVLVATSVIEVGVDVPRASIMLIEDAHQFGLAQLHQLRGRIGRGQQQAWCILISDARREEARRRLEILTQTQDGFVVAEEDLRLRGPGELLGQAQSGMPPFRFTDLTRDLALLERARQRARGRP